MIQIGESFQSNILQMLQVYVINELKRVFSLLFWNRYKVGLITIYGWLLVVAVVCISRININ